MTNDCLIAQFSSISAVWWCHNIIVHALADAKATERFVPFGFRCIGFPSSLLVIWRLSVLSAFYNDSDLFKPVRNLSGSGSADNFVLEFFLCVQYIGFTVPLIQVYKPRVGLPATVENLTFWDLPVGLSTVPLSPVNTCSQLEQNTPRYCIVLHCYCYQLVVVLVDLYNETAEWSNKYAYTVHCTLQYITIQ